MTFSPPPEEAGKPGIPLLPLEGPEAQAFEALGREEEGQTPHLFHQPLGPVLEETSRRKQTPALAQGRGQKARNPGQRIPLSVTVTVAPRLEMVKL
jgi:hypothetical protein